jgi:hypothetical protein
MDKFSSVGQVGVRRSLKKFGRDLRRVESQTDELNWHVINSSQVRDFFK